MTSLKGLTNLMMDQRNSENQKLKNQEKNLPMTLQIMRNLYPMSMQRQTPLQLNIKENGGITTQF